MRSKLVRFTFVVGFIDLLGKICVRSLLVCDVNVIDEYEWCDNNGMSNKQIGVSGSKKKIPI